MALLLLATFLGSLLLALCVFAFLVGAFLGGSVLGLLCALLSRHVGLSFGEVKRFCGSMEFEQRFRL